MSKRKQSSTLSSTVKRRRGSNFPAFGAPTEDDASLLLQPSQFPSASALSTRILPQEGAVPSLSSLAARRFVTHLPKLAEKERSWTYARHWLKVLPDAIVPRLFAMLRSTCPTILSHGFIVLYFFRGSSLVLSNELPGVQKQTITSITKNPFLRELRLTGFDKFDDTLFASVLPSLPHLRVLVLRGCSKVSTKTAEAISEACPSLITLNLNYTSVPPVSLVGVLNNCTELEVLKVAGIPNWTDATFAKLLAGLSHLVLQKMRTLKFRQLGLSETSIYPFISRCPNLTRLDVSFTRIHRLPPSATAAATSHSPPLEKLSLTSTLLSSADLISLITSLPTLRTLYLGAIGGGQGTSASMSNVTAVTMTDDTLTSLTDVMSLFPHLDKLSLVGNAKLGLMSRRRDEDRALADFVRRVGRKCRHLNLSGITYLRSQDLSGLMPETIDDGPPRLEELALNNTGIGDDAAPFIACCTSLTVLEVAGTKLTSTGLFPIIDACTKLEKLDLTSCRGIKVADRRRFFEVWETEWKNT